MAGEYEAEERSKQESKEQERCRHQAGLGSLLLTPGASRESFLSSIQA
jgi:hypothetical protein